MTEDQRLTIRQALSADAEALRELAARIYYETFASVNTPENMNAYLTTAFTLTQVQSELIESASTFYLAEMDTQLAGYAKLMASSEVPACITGKAPVELVRFYIDRVWQGTGLASALMEHCLNEAKRQGFSTMYLGVWEHNTRAQAFYRKWDFVRVGEHIFQMGDDPQTDWWMMRSI